VLGVLDAAPIRDAVEAFLSNRLGRALTFSDTHACGVSDGSREWRVSASGTALPFVDGSFDRVLCLDSLRSQEDPERFLVEARRVLVPGGGVLSVAVEPPARAVRGYLVKAGFDWSESYEVMTVEHVLDTGVEETHVFAATGWISGP